MYLLLFWGVSQNLIVNLMPGYPVGFQMQLRWQMNYRMYHCGTLSPWVQIFSTKEMSVNALIPYLHGTPCLCKYCSISFFRDDLVGSLSPCFSWEGILFMVMANKVAGFP
jgi:hypothetical protein